VQSIAESDTAVNVTYRLEGGTEDQGTSSGNIQNLKLQPFDDHYVVWHGTPWAVPSNHTFDKEFVDSMVRPDRLYHNFTWGFHVVDRSYGEAHRAVGLLNVSWVQSDFEDWLNFYTEWIWDRQTGVLLSMLCEEYFAPRVYLARFFMDIMDTSLWQMVQHPDQVPKLAVIGAVPATFAIAAAAIHTKRLRIERKKTANSDSPKASVSSSDCVRIWVLP